MVVFNVIEERKDVIMKKKSIFRIISVILALVFVFTVAGNSTEVNAKSKTKKVTTKCCPSSDRLEAVSKAPAVKKGKNVVTCKGNNRYDFYVKFTAPETKTYTITLSNVRNSKDKNEINGHFYIKKTGTSYVVNETVKTQNGKTQTLRVGNKKWCNTWTNHEKKVDRYRTSRYAKLKLQQGETIYVATYFVVDNNKGTTKYDLSIK